MAKNTAPPTGQRHNLVRMVSACGWPMPTGIWENPDWGQDERKSAIPTLLDTLNMVGSIITIDAIACQLSIVGKVVARGLDCVITLKKNAKPSTKPAITY